MALSHEFKPKLTAADVHKLLRERKKKSSESTREYLYKMIEIGSMADVDETSIISYTIDGIRGSPFHKAILYGANNVDELKEKLLIYDKIQQELQHKDNADKNGFQNLKIGHCEEQRDLGRLKYRRNCYNCGSENHQFYNCPNKSKGPKCFRCNQYGHVGAECSRRREATTNVIRKNESHHAVKVNGVVLEGLIDTGSEISIIKESLVNTIKPKYLSKNSIIPVRGLGATVNTGGTCIVDVQIQDTVFENVEMHTMKNTYLKCDVIIGMNLLKNAEINMSAGKIKINKTQDTAVSAVQRHSGCEELSECFLMNIDAFAVDGLPEMTHLKKEIQREVYNLITNYSPVEFPETPIQMKIVTIDDVPIYRPPRRFSPIEQNIIETQIQDLEETEESGKKEKLTEEKICKSEENIETIQNDENQIGVRKFEKQIQTQKYFDEIITEDIKSTEEQKISDVKINNYRTSINLEDENKLNPASISSNDFSSQSQYPEFNIKKEQLEQNSKDTRAKTKRRESKESFDNCSSGNNRRRSNLSKRRKKDHEYFGRDQKYKKDRGKIFKNKADYEKEKEKQIKTIKDESACKGMSITAQTLQTFHVDHLEPLENTKKDYRYKGVKMKLKDELRIMKIIEEEWNKQFEEEREELREKARQEIKRIQEENMKNFNARRKTPIQYQIGDRVAIERAQYGTGLKIRPKFFGPYKITAVKGFNRYKVEKEGQHEGPKETECSVEKMKPWSNGEEAEFEVVEDESLNDHGHSNK